ncbi:MAG TPA: SUMF1/EgtB/PvdO family nonheme iron enzyme [Verrucomicrobiae bacterium]
MKNNWRIWVVGWLILVVLGSAFYWFIQGTRRHFAHARQERQLTLLPARFTNTLGQIFVRVPGTEAGFCLWKTRVQDFSGYLRENGMATNLRTLYAPGSNGWSGVEATWSDPVFAPGPLYPVCGVTWFQATDFCRWLTEREHAAGDLDPHLVYRLPTDAEWSLAVTQLKFPWGSQWPPLDNTANLGGEETRSLLVGQRTSPIANYRDGFERTSPVGSFGPNPRGLYDMAGNLNEWCEDWYTKELNDPSRRAKHAWMNGDGGGQVCKVLRGSSWMDHDPGRIASSTRFFFSPDIALTFVGFRVVLGLDTNAVPSTHPATAQH